MSSVIREKMSIGPLHLKNRITMAPMFTAYGNDDGTVSEALLEHYREMGKSGAAMVVVENAIVDGERSWFGRLLRIDRDDYIEGLAKLARSIKEGGAHAVIQINHGGRYAAIANPLAPSPIAAFDGPIPEELTVAQIEEIIDKYVAAALRAKRAGFDAVEVHGATGYLPVQFLSPRTNKRTDMYGGSLENRMRFGLQLVKAIMDALGADYPVGYRFMADEWLPDGLQPAESKIYAKELDKLGIAYLSVTAGVYESMFLEDKLALAAQENYMADLAGAIKAEVTAPVIAAGRIASAAAAERVISSGQADLVGLARILMADPQWPHRALAGLDGEINKCKNCGTCIGLIMKQRPIICAAWDHERKQKYTDLLKNK
ncbi:NADH:flavin oxidoreductase [Desulfofalx alkaliphila]|uniref:oxidoreductase n=1 Tax=Desulfofalx alkaliphila TaxID=105483 RepID=UPI0004E22389|nr:NADH:flavin oxidoreductase [Desulfofalx alkaliphila]